MTSTFLTLVARADWDAAASLISTADLSQTAGPAQWTPLHFAAAAEPSPLIHSILSMGGNIEARASSGSTPLHLASWYGTAAVSTLIHAGADVNARTKGGRTPFHFATRQGNIGVMQELIQFGADPNLKDNKGNTALHFAAAGEIETVSFIIDNGGKLGEQDEAGKFPIDIAIENGNLRNVDLINMTMEENGLYHKTVGMKPTRSSETGPLINLRRSASKLTDAIRDRAVNVYSSLSSVNSSSVIRNKKISEWSVEDIAQMSAAYCSHGLQDEEKIEIEEMVTAAVKNYKLTGMLITSEFPETTVLAKEILGINEGSLYNSFVNFIRDCRGLSKNYGSLAMAGVGGILVGLMLSRK